MIQDNLKNARKFATIELYEFEPGCEDVRVIIHNHDENEDLVFRGGEKVTQLVEDFMIGLSKLYHEEEES